MNINKDKLCFRFSVHPVCLARVLPSGWVSREGNYVVPPLVSTGRGSFSRRTLATSLGLLAGKGVFGDSSILHTLGPCIKLTQVQGCKVPSLPRKTEPEQLRALGTALKGEDSPLLPATSGTAMRRSPSREAFCNKPLRASGQWDPGKTQLPACSCFRPIREAADAASVFALNRAHQEQTLDSKAFCSAGPRLLQASP